jgi:hypothetical protein
MNVVLSALFVLCTNVLGFQNAEVDYHICVGRLPNASIAGSDFMNQFCVNYKLVEMVLRLFCAAKSIQKLC